VVLEEGVEREFRRSYIVAGLVACAVIVLVDATADSMVLIPLLVLPPLVAAGGTRRGTIIVACVSGVSAVWLGWADDIAGTTRHWVAIISTVLGGALAVWVASTRLARENQLAESLPRARRADRLKAALATGRMGEWLWDRRAGTIHWDANVAMLFGLEAADFEGTFDDWLQRVDERDREMVQKALSAGIDSREPYRFDHRCRWPDGTIHWIEGIGDVIVDRDGNEVIGAFGLAIDVDERHRQIEERSRLFELERRQFERAEYLAKINDVLANSVDADEIVQRVTQSVVPEIAEWCSVVISIDKRRDRPSITVAHTDPAKLAFAEKIQRDFPYDPDALFGAANVIRTGERELIADIDPAVFKRMPGGDILEELAIRNVVTLPLVGALGVLGSLQLVRCEGQPRFQPAELELLDEVAGRVGAALNSAVLFERQARGRAALDTLQQVSGRIAAAATSGKIVHAVLAYGSAGLGADGGVLFMLTDDGDLEVQEAIVSTNEAMREAEIDVAGQSIEKGSVVVTEFDRDITARMALGVPLRILNRTIGALVFTFNDYREFSPEELSMLVTLGSRCAGALERASLYERDRDIALTFQRRLMPALPRTPPWIEIAASYRPASGLAIGGDWYQVLDAGGGRVITVVGDAVGHGLVAAAAMGQLRASIATAVANNAEPSRAIAAVDLFAVQGADTIGASAAYFLFESNGPARYVSAGHVPSVLVRPCDPAVLLEDGRRPLLGFRAAEDHTVAAEVPFEPGDVIVMFTDGLVERRGEGIDDGLSRLVKTIEGIREMSPQAMCSALLEEMTRDYDPDDDVALLVIRRNESPTDEPPVSADHRWRTLD
jgi:PAS domain S-box-containing protein